MAYWAATRLEPRREKVAQYFLEQAGYEVYLPLVRWRTSRTRATRVSALFPGSSSQDRVAMARHPDSTGRDQAGDER